MVKNYRLNVCVMDSSTDPTYQVNGQLYLNSVLVHINLFNAHSQICIQLIDPKVCIL